MFRVAGLAATCFVGALAACGSSSEPAPSSRLIGPNGGTITANGVAIAIPAGALFSTRAIGIVEDPSGPPASYAALSPLFRFTPDGLTFAKPATVSFATTSSTRAGNVYWSNGSGYEPLPTKWSGATASAAVQHFSRGFVGIAPDDGGTEASDADVPPLLVGLGATCGASVNFRTTCEAPLTCLGYLCGSDAPGGPCDDNSECNSHFPGCGGPSELECVTATHTCECTCNCASVCAECPAPFAQLGQTCYPTATFDGSTGNLYPACILSLTCVNGTCQ